MAAHPERWKRLGLGSVVALAGFLVLQTFFPASAVATRVLRVGPGVAQIAKPAPAAAFNRRGSINPGGPRMPAGAFSGQPPFKRGGFAGQAGSTARATGPTQAKPGLPPFGSGFPGN
ncbi:MAG TPA: hypothetical protein VMV93_12160 [Chloroflexota bacterium]|nr:hypothetical protein [Chloroflexota bacterium]